MFPDVGTSTQMLTLSRLLVSIGVINSGEISDAESTWRAPGSLGMHGSSGVHAVIHCGRRFLRGCVCLLEPGYENGLSLRVQLQQKTWSLIVLASLLLMARQQPVPPWAAALHT